MRHRKSGKKFGMQPSHRKSMFRNMARSLITHGRIRTTVVRAKELRKVADGLITLALQNDLHARRQAYKVLENHQLVKKLFDEIGPKFVGVPGGFTRVVRLGEPRKGDNAPLAVIEFTALGAAEAPAAAPEVQKTEEPKAAPAKKAPKAAKEPKEPKEPKAPKKKAAASEEAPAEEAPKAESEESK